MKEPFENGTLILNHYQIKKVIGKGGFGLVYEATDIQLDRIVAIKVLLHGETTIDGQRGPGTFLEYKARFEREAKLNGVFTHNRNIVTIYSFEKDSNDNYYLIMEYLPGKSLATRLEEESYLREEQVYTIALDICNALADIHKAGIIHRDLKPSNILFRENGQAVVADFGIAQTIQDTRETRAFGRHHPGTPAYMSPEQAETVGFLRPASDLYTLGLIIYEIATGKLFVEERVLPASTVNPVISPALDTIIGRALQKNPEDRYQRADEMGKQFEIAKQNRIKPELSSYPPTQPYSKPLRIEPSTVPLRVGPVQPPTPSTVPAQFNKDRKLFAYVTGIVSALLVVVAILLIVVLSSVNSKSQSSILAVATTTPLSTAIVITTTATNVQFTPTITLHPTPTFTVLPTATFQPTLTFTPIPPKATATSIPLTPIPIIAACPSLQEVKSITTVDVKQINEPCGFNWNGNGNKIINAICPKEWICTWAVVNGNFVILQEGNNQSNRIYAGTWRYQKAYPSWDDIYDICKLLQKEQANTTIPVRYEPIPGGKTC